MPTITIWSLLSTSITSLLYEVTLKHRCILECSILLLVQLPLQFPHGGIKYAQLWASLGCAIQKHGWLSMALLWDGSSTPPYHSSQSVLLPTLCSRWASGGLLQVFLSLSDWGQGGDADYWLRRLRDDRSCTRLCPVEVCRSPVLAHVRVRRSPGVRHCCSLSEDFLLSQTGSLKTSALWFSNLNCQSLCSSFLETKFSTYAQTTPRMCF